MNLKAILTATGLGTVLAFTAFPIGARDVRVLGTTIASAEEHQEPNENDPAEEAKELSTKINREKAEGNDVLICAADTFRAAASDQLAIWAERTGEHVEHAVARCEATCADRDRQDCSGG